MMLLFAGLELDYDVVLVSVIALCTVRLKYRQRFFGMIIWK